MACSNGSSYHKGCRCGECRAHVANVVAEYRKRLYLKENGHQFPSDRVSSELPTKLVWEGSSVRGLSFRVMANMCGVSNQTISYLYHQKGDWCTRHVHDSIVRGLAPSEPVVLFDNTVIDALPHRWKLYALYAQGWSREDLSRICDENGWPHGWLRNFSSRLQFRHKSLEILNQLVELIGDRHGPSEQNKHRMMARGYFPLIHYTEEGKLLVSSLRPEQKRAWRRVQSKHGADASSGDGS